jgi:hypothetical protein
MPIETFLAYVRVGAVGVNEEFGGHSALLQYVYGDLWNNWTESPVSESGSWPKLGFDRRLLHRRRVEKQWLPWWNLRRLA